MSEGTSLAEALRAWFLARREDKPFQLAYGLFMLEWADTEAMLYEVLKKYARVTDAVARAIFTGTRTKVMMDHIKRIAHNTTMPKRRLRDLEHVFAQLTAINTMRDHLAHYASTISIYDTARPDVRFVTNRHRAPRYGDERTDAVTPQMLENMTSDLRMIRHRLNRHRFGRFRPWSDQPPAWLYISPQPISNRDKNLSNPRKRTAQKKPSQG